MRGMFRMRGEGEAHSYRSWPIFAFLFAIPHAHLPCSHKGERSPYSDQNWRPLRSGRHWWAASDSNREPVGYEPIALPLS